MFSAELVLAVLADSIGTEVATSGFAVGKQLESVTVSVTVRMTVLKGLAHFVQASEHVAAGISIIRVRTTGAKLAAGSCTTEVAVGAGIVSMAVATAVPIGEAHLVQVRVCVPILVTVNDSPWVVITVGTVGHEVVMTTASSVVNVGEQVRTVTPGLSIVNSWLNEVIVVGTLRHVAVKVFCTSWTSVTIF